VERVQAMVSGIGFIAVSDRADFAPRAAMMVTHGFASFNRGLRAYFFGLAALAWFIQPWALVLAASWVVAVLYWRDSRSATLATLAGRR
jgi:uncharacterized membrane protein